MTGPPDHPVDGSKELARSLADDRDGQVIDPLTDQPMSDWKVGTDKFQPVAPSLTSKGATEAEITSGAAESEQDKEVLEV